MQHLSAQEIWEACDEKIPLQFHPTYKEHISFSLKSEPYYILVKRGVYCGIDVYVMYSDSTLLQLVTTSMEFDGEGYGINTGCPMFIYNTDRPSVKTPSPHSRLIRILTNK